MKNFIANHKQMLRRSARTFYQAFIGSLAVSLPACEYLNKEIISSIIASAISAGIAAVMNYKEDELL